MSRLASAVSALDIAVIAGGPSTEAAVSRASAEGVQRALSEAGHRARVVALDGELVGRLQDRHIDVVFPVVHGALGEDGCLQGMLEVLGLPYVGSAVLASAVASDKIAAKAVFRSAGLPLAAQFTVARGDDLQRAAERVREALGRAVVVKPSAQGSAIGVTRVPASADLAALVSALDTALELDPVALCERFVMGREVTCGVLDSPSFGEARALAPTEIFAHAGAFYDFTSRYAAGGSTHRCPAALPVEVSREVQRVAMSAHRALGCRDLSRADFVVGDGDNGACVTLLEVNTLPGMTATSLYPEAAAQAGITMAQLCDGLARGAVARGARRFGEARPLP